MKHEQEDHFARAEVDQTLQSARTNQIMRLLEDIGILPGDRETSLERGFNDDD